MNRYSIIRPLVLSTSLVAVTPVMAQELAPVAPAPTDASGPAEQAAPATEDAAPAAEAPAESPPPAEQEAPPEEATPKMHLAVAPPPPPIARTDYVHEGFYLRFSVGPGFAVGTQRNKVLDESETVVDFSLGSELLVGGSPSPGITLGGGVLGDLIFGAAEDGTPGISVLGGPFLDAFPNNKEGGHLGVIGGVAVGSYGTETLVGGGAGLWAGYDLWVAPQWSTGFNLRGVGSHIASSDLGVTNFSLHFLITVLNH